ncbi:MAG: hypothetical protein OXG04_13535 [Acidobacteria bacterium]|nr:hypothetical protein [Acidobacteriota bacterium]
MVFAIAWWARSPAFPSTFSRFIHFHGEPAAAGGHGRLHQRAEQCADVLVGDVCSALSERDVHVSAVIGQQWSDELLGILGAKLGVVDRDGRGGRFRYRAGHIVNRLAM